MMTLLTNVNAVTDGLQYMMSDETRDFLRPVQVVITGDASVTVQGRCDPSLPWIDIRTYTASGADTIQVFRCMRARVSSITTGTATVWLDARQAMST